MRTPKSRKATSTSVPDQALEAFRQWGRQGGKKRAQKLSVSERQEAARKASQARWAKAKKRGS